MSYKAAVSCVLLCSSAFVVACGGDQTGGEGGATTTSTTSSTDSTTTSTSSTTSTTSTTSTSTTSTSTTSTTTTSSTTTSGTGGTGGSASIGAKMVINEVAPDAESGTDWIELYNAGDESADLSGWTMTDDDPTHVFTFAAGTTVAPGAYLTLDQNAADSFTFGLAKGGDQVNLYDANAALVDNTAWTTGQATLPTTWGRLPNGTGAFQTLSAATKGAANQ